MCIICSSAKTLFTYQTASEIADAAAHAAAAGTLDPIYAAQLWQIAGKVDTTQYVLQGGDLDLKSYDVQVLLVPIPDDVPDTITASNPQLVIGAPATISTINTQGDKDVYAVHLEAGVDYEIGMLSKNAGPSGVPLLDAYLILYDANGNEMTETDGGSETHPASIFLTGLDAMLSLRVEQSGTYYVAATSYDQVNGDGVGDTVGDYEIFARPAEAYKAYYDLDSPLHSIDWGTQVNKVHQSVRNPDGQEGPRPTGNAYEVPEGDALGHPGKNVITYYFAKQGELFVDENPTTIGLTTTMVAKGMEQWEKNAFVFGFEEYEKVADIVYIEVDNKDAADFVIVTYDGTPGNVGVSLLGRMSAPDEDNEGQTEVNAGDYRWTEGGVQKGGFYFGTIVHELGHGHGLAHMHDTGGHSSEARGVESAGITSPSGVNTPGGRVPLPTTVNAPDPTGIYPDYTLGDFELNQGVYSMMAYQDAWHSSPYGQASTSDPFGWLGSLMALDIAVIQDKYGVNEEWATGNDSYVLKDVNAVGTYYSSIWDAAGTDEIVYSGARDTTIDLRPATLKYEWGGGGFISYAWGIHGGFTIANGVTIENARSGSGNDTLVGNDAGNVLNGAAGQDVMTGGKGNDLYYVDDALDQANELASEGIDTVATRVSYTLGANVETLQANDIGGTDALSLTGNALDNKIYGTQGNNVLNGAGGIDFMVGYRGDDLYYADHAGDVAYEEGNGGTDTVATSVNYVLGSNVENLQANDIGGTAALSLTGNGQNNNIYGTQGNNVLNGAGGADLLVGYAGDDLYYVDNAGDLAFEEANGGKDTVATTSSYTLGANIENLQANDIGGTAALSLFGNELGNFVWGTQGNNVIGGRGGIDHLYGYGGADQFLFDTAPSAGNYDYLGDFQAGVDKILLDDAVFAALAPGALAAGAFVKGPAALDADDRIVLNNGALFYDADGNGAGAAVLVAFVSASENLTAADILVV